MRTPDPIESNPGTPDPRRLAIVRIIFVLYLGLLLVATLWPNLKVESDVIERPDLLAHLVSFGVFQFLLTACGFFARPAAMKNIVLSAATGLVFAGLNEATQALPVLGRTSAVDDYLANALGITASTCLWLAIAMFQRPRVQRS